MGDFLLKLEPAERVVIASKKLGEARIETSLSITNPGPDRVVVWIETNSVSNFKKNQVVCLAGSEVKTINFTYKGKTVPQDGRIYIRVSYLITNEEPQEPRKLFETLKPTIKQIPVIFRKEDEKKDDDKKDEKKEENGIGKKDGEKSKKDEGGTDEKDGDGKPGEGGKPPAGAKKEGDKKEEKTGIVENEKTHDEEKEKEKDNKKDEKQKAKSKFT